MIESRSAALSVMVCAGCGYEAPAAEQDPYPFRCARAGTDPDVDHVMTRVLDTTRLAFPHEDETNPFVRYRRLFHSHHVALAHGLTDGDYVALVRRLDDAVARVDGGGFRTTPFSRSAALSDGLGFSAEGGVWVKDETGNVSGSHKARHLMGIMIYLEVIERVGLVRGAPPPLAIASCGNAALAAAVVARAAGRELRVFIPPDAPREVVDRLAHLGARTTVCLRESAEPGDPCYRRFRAAVGTGALPFCCQGPANGLTIEGGETLGYEIVAAQGPALDRVVIQVGGGALASAVIQSFAEAMALGAATRRPRFHTVQTRGAFPLTRAYDRLAQGMLDALAGDGVGSGEARVERLARRFASPLLQAQLRNAATHRSAFMWPWDDEPRSIAHGILDDETYDWFAVVSGMIATGGGPVVVDEGLLVEAYDLAHETTGIDVDHTGVAGLAGLLQLRRDGTVGAGEAVAVLFSGVRRAA